MQIRLISVGRVREPFYREGVQEYLKRLKPYAPVELVEGLDEKLGPRAGAREVEGVLNREGQRVLGLLREDELLVALDAGGKAMDSEAFARWMEGLLLSGKTRLSFLVGSAAGISEAVKRRADHTVSLSAMTLPHQMAALLLAEQIYRAFKIMRGEPYHK
ncbi:MAG: 23S rRNA (pseudouridine(1915)-N(3))-methyltransferase RlmH [Firmicutes bacterium]|nr:23S rRNA (pseudouridine(1915)-N(3))-methyltransferase RlmH [Bacillota bacterium]